MWSDCDTLPLFSIPLYELGKVKYDGSPNTILCIVCRVLQFHVTRFLPSHSVPTRVFSFFRSLNCLFTSCLFFSTVSSAADKEVEDYYTRKRHLPDLAARSTLPLHVLKMSQEQVGTEVFRSIVHASKQGHVLSSFMYL